MKQDKFLNLIGKLDSHLIHHGDGLTPSISPTLVPGVKPGTLYPNMCVEALSKDELIMVHTNLHRFYPKGIKDVSKQHIEQLHVKVKKLIGHSDFDHLDRVRVENK